MLGSFVGCDDMDGLKDGFVVGDAVGFFVVGDAELGFFVVGPSELGFFVVGDAVGAGVEGRVEMLGKFVGRFEMLG